jgi:16S rRNA processing protein RimM
VALGSVRGAYGVKGWVRIALFGDDTVLRLTPQWWLQDVRGARCVAPEEQRRHGAALLAKWSGCESKEAADALKGVAVAVPRSAFPPAAEGEFYWADLAGCRVVNRDGEALGEVSGLRENAGGQWLEVSGTAGGNVLLVPLVERYVDAVDPAARVIRVDWQRDW